MSHYALLPQPYICLIIIMHKLKFNAKDSKPQLTIALMGYWKIAIKLFNRYVS